MKFTVKSLLGLIVCIALLSCEEVIDLDLGNAAPRIVIEGTITTDQGPYRVKINQSVDYGEINEFPPVSGAALTVTDEEGTTEVLEEVEEGVYLIQALEGENGKTYTLEVNYDQETYQASSTLP